MLRVAIVCSYFSIPCHFLVRILGFASFFNDASPTMMMGGWSMFMIKALSPRLVRSAFDRTTDLR